MSFFNFFKKKEPPPPPRIPVVGEVWSLRSSSGDPWGAKDGKVKILDVRSGWIRYSISRIFPDERMKVETFLYCYYPPEIWKTMELPEGER